MCGVSPYDFSALKGVRNPMKQYNAYGGASLSGYILLYTDLRICCTGFSSEEGGSSKKDRLYISWCYFYYYMRGGVGTKEEGEGKLTRVYDVFLASCHPAASELVCVLRPVYVCVRVKQNNPAD